MARIPEAELERLKSEVSVQRLAEVRGVAFEKTGDNLVGRCPFHQDDTPSFIVTPKKNLWHCMGACQAGGSCIDFVMKAEGVGFRHAVELLRAGLPQTTAPAVRVLHNGPAPSAPPPAHSTARKLPSPLDSEADDEKLLSQVVDYYHQRLLQTPDALAYLEKRGLASNEAVTHFRLGFSDRTLGLRVPAAQRKDGAALREKLLALGVLRESGHEHLCGSLVVPILDAAGKVKGMYGRKVTQRLRAGTALHLYLPGPHRGVFNEAALAEGGTVILCEALLDALTFWVAGFRNVTSSYGVQGFTPLHLEALKRHGVRRVLLAYDRDDAGDAAATELGKQLLAQGIDCWRVLFPRGLDANHYALKVQPAAKALGVALRQAVWMGADGAAKPAPNLEPSPAALSSLVALAAPGPVPAPASALPVAQEEEELPATSAPESIGAVEVEISTPPTASSHSSAAASPPAPPAAASAAAEEPREESSDERVFHFGPRRYRVRGLSKNSAPDALKVNVLAACGDAFHVDTFDMYQAKARAHFVTQTALELRTDAETVKRDVGQLLLKLELQVDEARKAAAGPKVPVLSEDERQEALTLLRTPDLMGRVLKDFEACGVVGEETNKLVGYLAAISRKLEEPLAVLIQSSSAAGKSSLMEACLAFVPEEDKVKYSAMTGQSLFYMGDLSLRHKVLAVVEEEGASRAAYALKLLQSEGELTIASTGKDPTSGKLVTHEYHVEGPTQLFLTTTATELDEELLNRCLVLAVDEDRAQTQSIHRLQREKQTLEGLLARRERDSVLRLHQNAQRLLRPLLVANPFAPQLTFLDDRTRTRRDFPKYLTLIRAIALLHQYQRPVRTVRRGDEVVEYVEVERSDVETANRLVAQVLGHSLNELPPQTRRVLLQLEGWVARSAKEAGEKPTDFRFTRRQVREALRLGHSQLALHLARLEALEYVAARRAGQGGGLVYQLLHTQADAGPLPGLADAGALAPEASGGAGEVSGPFRGASGLSAQGRNASSAGVLPLLGAEVSGPGRNGHSPLSSVGVVSHARVAR